jgi:hypothetical protein
MKKEVVMKKLFVAIALLLAPAISWAHHGGVSLAFGPGSPVETGSPLTLPEGGFVTGFRAEQVEWKKFGFAEPNNKSSFTFLNANLSYGFTPALTGTLIVPYYIKRQDGLGSNDGLADVKLQLTYGFHCEPGIGCERNKAEDAGISLEGKNRTYLGISAMMGIPNGDHNKKLGGEADPGMQTGFGAPSYTLGITAARAFGSLTLNAEASADIFTERQNFQFGSEARGNLAGVYELYGNPNNFLAKLDGILELNFLHLERDKENGEGLEATGGNILYLSPGMRFSFPSLANANVGVLVKLPVWKNLNEQGQQQGGEGLEKYRLITTLSLYF